MWDTRLLVSLYINCFNGKFTERGLWVEYYYFFINAAMLILKHILFFVPLSTAVVSTVMINRYGSGSAVLRIHGILVWIRIRIWIRGFMPLTDGSGSWSGSCYFPHWPSRCQKRFFFCLKVFFVYYFLKLHLHHFSKIKSHKTVGIKVFLTIFSWW